MSLHVFGAIITQLGTAANNRGLTEGNTTTLQKVIWNQQVHTTVSAESIRFALRRRLAESGEPCNRNYNEDERSNVWTDPAFSKEDLMIDDDLLGFMIAEAAKEETSDEPQEAGDKKKPKAKGTAKVRRAVLEVTRSVSLTPWPGDVTFNAASPGATPSAQKKGSNPVPYGTEFHATRYQYGFAMTPEKLKTKDKAGRTAKALRGLCAIGEVAGNHGRFLFDFSPETIVLRLTDDPAPRLLYSFSATESGAVSAPDLLRKVAAGDIKPGELVIGGAWVSSLTAAEKEILKGAELHAGVLAACEAACKKIAEKVKS